MAPLGLLLVRQTLAFATRAEGFECQQEALVTESAIGALRRAGTGKLCARANSIGEQQRKTWALLQGITCESNVCLTRMLWARHLL